MPSDVVIKIGARNTASAMMKKVGTDVGRLGTRVGRFSVAASASIKQLASQFSFLGVASAGAVGALGLRTFAEFDSGMAHVAAVTGATGDALDSMRDKAKELGSTTKFTAAQAAEGMKFLGMAGYDTNQILAGIGPTLSLAAAGALELGEAADIASDVSSAFGLAATDIGMVADVLATTATSANTTVSMMGETFAKVAPVARAAGQSLQEASAAAGILGNSGLKAGKAGTDLKNILANLATPVAQAKLKELGVTIRDELTGEFLPLLDIMASFEEKTLSMNGPDKLALAMDVFGKISGASALVLSKAGDQVDVMRMKMANAAGTANKMAATMQDSIGGIGTKIKSALQGTAIDALEAMKGSLEGFGNSLVDSLRQISSWFTTNEEGMKAVGKVFGIVFPAAGNAIGLMAKGLAEVSIAISSLLAPALNWLDDKLRGMMPWIDKIRIGLAAVAVAVTEALLPGELAPVLGGSQNQLQMMAQQAIQNESTRVGLETKRLDIEKKITEALKSQGTAIQANLSVAQSLNAEQLRASKLHFLNQRMAARNAKEVAAMFGNIANAKQQRASRLQFLQQKLDARNDAEARAMFGLPPKETGQQFGLALQGVQSRFLAGKGSQDPQKRIEENTKRMAKLMQRIADNTKPKDQPAVEFKQVT